MNDDQFSFFKQLVETKGPSGYEQDTQRVWRSRVEGAAQTVRGDRLGSCIAVLNEGGRPRVMLDAHIDEIGFIIRHIDENGYLYFSPIGGFDSTTLAGNRVAILGKNGTVPGIIGRKPIHLIRDDERKKAPELRDMWIDIGVADKAEAESLLAIGDAGGRAAPMERLQGSLVACASMDDRVGCYVVAEALLRLASESPSSAVLAVSSVQEEIGLRGARASAYETDAEVGIAVEVTWTSDHPQASKTELGDIQVGKGPVISRGANSNPRVVQRMVEAAQAEGVPYQIDAAAGGTPTDQNVMQMSRSGMATGLISVPTRYLHTASEVVSTDDIDATVAIVARFVGDLGADADLIP
jgi:tetrahedral aminopeptidase